VCVFISCQLISIHSITFLWSGTVTVLPSQKIKLYKYDPTNHSQPLLLSTYHVTPASHQALGLARTQWPLLHEGFHSQSQLIQKLQEANNALENHIVDSPSDITNAAAKATSSVAQAIFVFLLIYSLFSNLIVCWGIALCQTLLTLSHIPSFYNYQ